MTRNYRFIDRCLNDPVTWNLIKGTLEGRAREAYKVLLARELVAMIEPHSISYSTPLNGLRGDYSKEFKGGPV